MATLVISDTLRSWVILSGLCVLCLLINMDYTAVNIALVPVSQDFAADLNTLQWALSGYVLAWSAFVVAGGKLADIYGKRRLLLWGVSIFLVASVICGLANSALSLIMGRILQGFGGALFCSSIYTLLFTSFPKEQQGFAVGMLGVSAGLGLAIGPTFAGTIIELVGWRWIFLVNVPLCLVSISIISLTTPPEAKRLSDDRFDVIGSILLGVTLAISVFSLNQFEVWGFTSFKLWSFFAISLVMLTAFLVSQAKLVHPLIPRGLFKNKPFVACLVSFAICEAGFATLLLLVTLFLQNVMNYGPFDAAKIFLAYTLAFGFFSPLGGKMLDKLGGRIPIVGGTILMMLGLLLAAQLNTASHINYILITLCVLGLGMGILFPVLNAVMMKVVDPKELSTAAGVFVMGATLFMTIGVVMSSNLLIAIGEPVIASTLGTGASPELQQIRSALINSAHRDLSLLADYTATETQQYISIVNQAFQQAMSYIFYGCLGLTSIALVMSFRITEKPLS